MLSKIGTSEKILELAKNSAEFANLWDKIEKENNLVKCSNCKHLLSKKGVDNSLTLKHKKMLVVVKDAKGVELICPICNTVNRLV